MTDKPEQFQLSELEELDQKYFLDRVLNCIRYNPEAAFRIKQIVEAESAPMWNNQEVLQLNALENEQKKSTSTNTQEDETSSH